MSALQFAPTITKDDVKEFRRQLNEEAKTLTPEKARESLIRAGVLDQNGKPKWPVNGKKQESQPSRDA
jgi:hypothetical protein